MDGPRRPPQPARSRLASRAARAAVLLALPVGLIGCGTMPPNPTATALPAPVLAPSRWSGAVADPVTGTPSPASAGDRWWQVFHDPRLDALQQQAMAANPRIAEAAAAVDQARARAGLAAAGSRPQLALDAGASRQGGPLLNDAGSTGSLWRAGLALQLAPDLGGARAASHQAALHDLQQHTARWQHTRLQVQVEVAAAWLAAQDTARQRPWLEALAAHWAHAARLEARRHAAGLASADAADAARTEAAAASAQLQAHARQAALQRHALAALLGGQLPADDAPTGPAGPTGPTGPDGPVAPAAHLADWPAVPTAPDAWPVPAIPPGLPSQLLARRSDIAAADAAVQAARQRLGAAQADGWPVLQLTAAGGVASDDVGQLLRSAARSWSLAGLLSLPLLDGGRRDAQRAAAEATLAEAAAAWRQQVLQALREVDDQLATLQSLHAQAAAQQQAQAAAERSVAAQRGLLARGLASPLAVLAAQRRLVDAHLAAARTQAERRQATLALVQALGGGWDMVEAAAAPAAGD